MRKNIVLIHLFLAALTAPALALVAVSGGLYLLGVKGQVANSEIPLPADADLDFTSASIDAEIKVLLDQLSLQHRYQYLQNRGNILRTRPTSRTYLEFTKKNGELTLAQKDPDWQKAMIELHKGHGPIAFKIYQKFVAISLLFIVFSGLWLGLSSPALRTKTLSTAVTGFALFLALALYQ